MTIPQKCFLALYQTLWLFAPLFLRRYLKRRAIKAPQYLENWHERFGQAYPQAAQNCIWIHAVSVGEMRAAEPLVIELQKYFPHLPLLITQMTPTGRQTAEYLFPHAQIRYLPYDKKSYVQNFLETHQPIFGVLMETEIWPNLIRQCHKKNIPLFLANARLSEKSLQGYLKAKQLIIPAINLLNLTCAQTQEDANRLKLIGAQQIEVCGNTKYDIEVSEEAQKLSLQFKEWIGSRQVVLCASTREGEDALLLNAWQHKQTDILLIIVSRHPERFDQIEMLANKMGFKTQRRSDNQKIAPETQVWIGDSMGELSAYYLATDIAFVGGSLVDVGGQNILEPLQCQKATLFGFSTFNFQQICIDALDAKAAIQVKNAEQWAQISLQLLENKKMQDDLILNAQSFVQKYKGASQKIAQLIHTHITENEYNL